MIQKDQYRGFWGFCDKVGIVHAFVQFGWVILSLVGGIVVSISSYLKEIPWPALVALGAVTTAAMLAIGLLLFMFIERIWYALGQRLQIIYDPLHHMAVRGKVTEARCVIRNKSHSRISRVRPKLRSILALKRKRGLPAWLPQFNEIPLKIEKAGSAPILNSEERVEVLWLVANKDSFIILGVHGDYTFPAGHYKIIIDVTGRQTRSASREFTVEMKRGKVHIR